MLSAAALPVVSGVFQKWRVTTASAAPMLRPAPRTAAGQVCARCGAAGHTALDPACPANAGSSAAIQAAARRAAGLTRRADV